MITVPKAFADERAMRDSRWWRFRPILLRTALLLGCGPSNSLGRRAISGSVSLDGVPLDQGSIEFAPQGNREGVGTGAMLLNGQYSTSTLKGLPPGKYVVRISSAEPHEKNSSKRANGPPGRGTSGPAGPAGFDMTGIKRNRIPARYNAESQLFVEVTEEGENKFDFKLTRAE